jgi:hypothetical protein
MKLHPRHVERVFKVNMIEMQKRQHAGISFRPRQMSANIRASEMRAEQSRCQPARPLVEVSEHNSRARQPAVVQYRLINQLAPLMAALKESGSQMDVEDVQQSVCGDFDICAKASSLLAPAHADVIAAGFAQRKTAQHHVAIYAAFKHPRPADRMSHAQLLGYESRLIVFGRGVGYAQDFLKRDDVGIDFAQDFRDALRPHSAIKAATFVNIICDYPNPHSIEMMK